MSQMNLEKKLNIMFYGKLFLFVFIMNLNVVYAMTQKSNIKGNQIITEEIWKELKNKNYDQVILLANKCLDTVYEKAIAMQKDIRKNRNQKKILTKDDIYENWALNYAGECLYLLGEAYQTKGNFNKANIYYQRIIDEFPNSFGGTSTIEIWPIKNAAEYKIRELKGNNP